MSRMVRGLSVLIYICLITIFILGLYKLSFPYDSSNYFTYGNFMEDWENEDGTSASLDHIRGNEKICREIPELSKDSVLFMFVHTVNIKVYINDKLIFDTYGKNNLIYRKTPGAAFVKIDIEKADSGKMLYIDIDNPYEDSSGRISNIQLGNEGDILLAEINSRLPAFATSVVITAIGCCFFILFLPLYKKKMVGTEMLYLGIFTSIVGVFMMMDCRIKQMLVSGENVSFLPEEAIMPLILPPLLLFVWKMYKDFTKRIISIMVVLSFMSFGVCWVLNLTGIKDFHETIILTHITYVIAIILVIGNTLKSIIERNFKNIFHRIGCITISFAAAIDMVIVWRRIPMEANFFTRIGVPAFLFLETLEIVNMILQKYQMSIETKILSRLAYHDGLTGLLNRTSYMEAIEQLQKKTKNDLLVAMFDVNNLKKVNDTYGHQSGDEMIKRVASTIQGKLGTFGKCYRIGGDEFVFISEEKEAEMKFMGIKDKLSSEYGELSIDDKKIKITVAMGYSVKNRNMNLSVEDVIREADSKMYCTKHYMKSH